ncbi:MAG: hypothetical protein L0Y79_04865 [Chlorobi bacterium]|nr:hypothetical protein [Chlorobiota bacterium]MCI0716593.1 hypothetical protein [Chlorobiota bacterium]
MDDTVMNFNSEIEQAFQSAYHAEKGGDAKWKGVMDSYGSEGLSQEMKEKLLNSEMKIVRGAFPIELRRVYEAIIGKYSAQAGGNQPLQSAINGFDIETKVLEYYQKIKPFSGLGDIFKNASTGTAKYSQGLKGEKQSTYKCKNCGAPRLEEMQYDNCLFCGSKLFERV